MGQVYLARATGLGGFERQVVVKTLDPDPDESEELVEMFLDEARLLGALHHQYIAQVYEVGCDDRGRYYLVMDYVRGETAEAVMKAATESLGKASLGFALTVVSAVASALDYAHALRAPDGSLLEIVHRDVSLSNIMIGYDGGVKLIDFGIAKFKLRTSQTQIGSLKGKLSYLSPEQILNKPVDHRADLFALGICLYELTTLQRAFVGDSELITLEKITKGDLKLPSQVVADYPRELERIVMKALALDPKLRFQSAGEMSRELEAFAAKRGIAVGHAVIAEAMHAWFEPSGNRRRFPRASSEVETGRHEKQDPEEFEDTPIEPIEALEVSTDRVAALDHPSATLRVAARPGEAGPFDSPTERTAKPTVPQSPVALQLAPLPPPIPVHELPTTIAAPSDDAPTIPLEPMQIPPTLPIQTLADGSGVGPSSMQTLTGVPPAPLIIRIGTPPPTRAKSPGTVTAQLPHAARARRIPRAPVTRWWWPIAILALAAIVALIVALV